MTERLEDVLLELQELAARAWVRAHEDHKTPLLNERGLARDGDQHLADERSWTVFSGDVNDFKSLNATIGYASADLVLHAVGAKLAEICQELGASGYRRGGDEFVLLVLSDKAEGVASALSHELFPLHVPLNEPVDVQLSFGYAELDAALPFKDTLDRADDACKAAKWATDGRPVRWTPEVQTGVHERFRCGACRSQFSMTVAPERAHEVAALACMICRAPLGAPAASET